MIAPFVSAVLVSAIGVVATTGILTGILSLFQKYIKPSSQDKGASTGTGTGSGSGTGGGVSGVSDHVFLSTEALDLKIRKHMGGARGAGAGT